jgi:hypothetical protein
LSNAADPEAAGADGAKIMSKLGLQLSVALILGLAASPPSLSEASDSFRLSTADDHRELAFSLDDMNCFSSDIQARAVTSETASAEPSGPLIATESGGGTNGIPCNRRDPKAPPHKRSRT